MLPAATFAGSYSDRNKNCGLTSKNAKAFSMPSSKLPFFFCPVSKKPASRDNSASVTGRRYARRASVERTVFAQGSASAPDDGRQVKIRRRLGEFPAP